MLQQPMSALYFIIVDPFSLLVAPCLFTCFGIVLASLNVSTIVVSIQINLQNFLDQIGMIFLEIESHSREIEA